MNNVDDSGTRMDISLVLPEEVNAVIKHKAMMSGKEPAKILEDIVQQMFNDKGGEIAQLLSE